MMAHREIEPRRYLSAEQIAKRKRLEAEKRERNRERRGQPASRNEIAAARAEEAARRAAEKHAVAEKAKAAGMKKRQIRAPDGSIQEVWSFDTSYHAMGFQEHHIRAAERFAQDWEIAYRVLKGQGFEPSVDGARSIHGPLGSILLAQDRLAKCKKALGEDGWLIVTGVVIYGATCRQIHKLGGHDHRTIKAMMDAAFNKLDAFYHGTPRKDRTLIAFSRFNEDRAAMLEGAGGA